MDEHTGTHVNAPRHFIPPPDSQLPHAGPAGDIGVDRLPLLAAAGPASVVDVAGLSGTTSGGASPPVTVAELTAWEDANGAVRPGDVVLLRTGWDSRYRSGPEGAEYGTDALVRGTGPGWPAPTPEAVGWLHERGVRCIGTDGLSMGPAEGGGPTHLAGSAGAWSSWRPSPAWTACPARGAWFLFLPLNLVDGTGAPGRALAVLP